MLEAEGLTAGVWSPSSMRASLSASSRATAPCSSVRSSEPWRCLGYALQAQGYHQEAINAFHKAAQYDPLDKSLDAAIEKSQRGIVADFLNRYRR